MPLERPDARAGIDSAKHLPFAERFPRTQAINGEYRTEARDRRGNDRARPFEKMQLAGRVVALSVDRRATADERVDEFIYHQVCPARRYEVYDWNERESCDILCARDLLRTFRPLCSSASTINLARLPPARNMQTTTSHFNTLAL